MIDDTNFYLGGPMSGKPYHNVPAFEEAAKELREAGWTITSPAELDGDKFRNIVMQDPTGEATNVGAGDTIEGHTWGDLLARDVKLISDECGGIILLQGWDESKGARLETFVAIQCGYPILEFNSPYLIRISHEEALSRIMTGVLR